MKHKQRYNLWNIKDETFVMNCTQEMRSSKRSAESSHQYWRPSRCTIGQIYSCNKL